MYAIPDKIYIYICLCVFQYITDGQDLGRTKLEKVDEDILTILSIFAYITKLRQVKHLVRFKVVLSISTWP